uniref:Cytochrome P450 n=1 Tax=Solanum tuberosum TaxID=4113 RepID=M1B6J2_SOLTU
MGETVVVLGGASGNKFLFSNENKQVILWWPVTVKKLLGPCLANSVGEEAKIMKKMLSSFVSPDAFSRLYIKAMQLVVHHHFMNYWQDLELGLRSGIYIEDGLGTLNCGQDLGPDLWSDSQVLGWRLVVGVEVESQVSSRVRGHVSGLRQGKSQVMDQSWGQVLDWEFKLARS